MSLTGQAYIGAEQIFRIPVALDGCQPLEVLTVDFHGTGFSRWHEIDVMTSHGVGVWLCMPNSSYKIQDD